MEFDLRIQFSAHKVNPAHGTGPEVQEIDLENVLFTNKLGNRETFHSIQLLLQSGILRHSLSFPLLGGNLEQEQAHLGETPMNPW